MKRISFFDIEVTSSERIADIGCVRWDEAVFHANSVPNFFKFISDSQFICGHNIVRHDLRFLKMMAGPESFASAGIIDTLFLSPLLFPDKPYHRLIKDDKLLSDELNNPVNDSKKARDLFFDEIAAFRKLDDEVQMIFFNLLNKTEGFSGFFECIDYSEKYSSAELTELIARQLRGKACSQADIMDLIKSNPICLAYAIALLNTTSRYSITPPWVLHNFPEMERLMFLLRGKPCLSGCAYCNQALDPFQALYRHFNYSQFRSYDGEPLQEKAVRAAIANKSLLALFPTGGGKSITFQLPALMAGENTRALTVIISPLQSLMKDQVDNLEKKDITDAVTINGLLDPIERGQALERVADGRASLLYLSPESLRSASIENLLLGRKIARFVVDEAHCFSSWGQDFRVDYLYIGDFIHNLQRKKGSAENIPVSCFTATAKPQVVEDICNYFEEKLGMSLEVFKASGSRTNLQYKVFASEGEEQKYTEVRRLLEYKSCPTIVYVSRTKKALKVAEKLSADGFSAKAFHGKMDKEEKKANQDAFMKGTVDIMVATSAFGMGVDKSNVGMVIHYDLSDSLENYIQEAGRAGRDEKITADCYVLFNEDDLNAHFRLLNQTKLDIKEINQVWKAIKDLTRTRDKVSDSALEIARKAGWDDDIKDIETRVKTAVAALEEAGYVARGQNTPRIFANSILSPSAEEAIKQINASGRFDLKEKDQAARIIKKLFSSKSKRLNTDETAESRIDYISDHLGMSRHEVIRIVQLLREEKILADAKDLTAFIKRGDNSSRSISIAEKYCQLEIFLLNSLKDGEDSYNLKEINENALMQGPNASSLNNLKTLLNFWAIKNWVKRKHSAYSQNHLDIGLLQTKDVLRQSIDRRHALVKLIIKHLYSKALHQKGRPGAEEVLVEFSVLELKAVAEAGAGMFVQKFSTNDIEDSLFYLSRTGAIKMEGGFLVIYNKLNIERLEKNNRVNYKQADYEKLRQYYQNKVQQIHIIGEYAKKMIENYNDALRFVDDYFQLNYQSFLDKYFPGSRRDDIRRTLTPEKFRQLFGNLSPSQLEIIRDASSQNIVVAAGPGSGKTRVLVHKLASLLLTEDVKHEQLLMLTFSRAAATEFKKRLLDLIGPSANYVEIKTFHSYCFDLLGKIGNLSQADSILETAIAEIRNNNIEESRITKTVLVVDEAQDINSHEYRLIKTLMERNEDMRVILVGDDDQNIYEFRGADSKYMQAFIIEESASKYELVVNYRSKQNIVELANQWADRIKKRLKKYRIMAHDQSNGIITITRYASAGLVTPLVEEIKATGLSGSTCVLTTTNAEAAQVNGLLRKHGFPSKLIQSNDGFPLINLKELRFFSNIVHTQTDSPIILQEEWDEAKMKLTKEFQRSSNLTACLSIIKAFELVNPIKKYKSDWKTFLFESKLEDFLRIKGDSIYVSTIHKSKGKEFDNVFILLNKFDPDSEECKRQLYVAMTRAKDRLSIHHVGNYLSGFVASNMIQRMDLLRYPPAQQISIALTLKDVYLGFFDSVQDRVNSLFSGDVLNVDADGLFTSAGPVLRFSNSFRHALVQNGGKYVLKTAKINHLVYWFNQKTQREILVILPELTLELNP